MNAIQICGSVRYFYYGQQNNRQKLLFTQAEKSCEFPPYQGIIVILDDVTKCTKTIGVKNMARELPELIKSDENKHTFFFKFLCSKKDKEKFSCLPKFELLKF